MVILSFFLSLSRCRSRLKTKVDTAIRLQFTRVLIMLDTLDGKEISTDVIDREIYREIGQNNPRTIECRKYSQVTSETIEYNTSNCFRAVSHASRSF